MIKVKDLFKQEMNWVGPKCNHKSLYQREGEGDYKPKTCDRVEDRQRVAAKECRSHQKGRDENRFSPEPAE